MATHSSINLPSVCAIAHPCRYRCCPAQRSLLPAHLVFGAWCRWSGASICKVDKTALRLRQHHHHRQSGIGRARCRRHTHPAAIGRLSFGGHTACQTRHCRYRRLVIGRPISCPYSGAGDGTRRAFCACGGCRQRFARPATLSESTFQRGAKLPQSVRLSRYCATFVSASSNECDRQLRQRDKNALCAESERACGEDHAGTCRSLLLGAEKSFELTNNAGPLPQIAIPLTLWLSQQRQRKQPNLAQRWERQSSHGVQLTYCAETHYSILNNAQLLEALTRLLRSLSTS